MNRILVIALTIALGSATGVAAQNAPAARKTSPAELCKPRAKGFFALAAELNAAQNCAQLMCYKGSWGSVENKEIGGYTLNDWLWSGPSPKSFTVTEETGFMAAAQARAVALRPAGKSLIKITYFTDFLVPTQGGAYFLGARAYYGKCVGNSGGGQHN